MLIFLLIILIFFLLLEGTVTTLPLTFLFLLSFTIVKRAAVFPVAFFAGIFLDLLTLRPMGTTSLFFLTSFFLVLLYQRKYEIHTTPFVFVASLIGSGVFLWAFGYRDTFIQAGVSSFIGVLLFGGMKLLFKK